MQPLPLVCNAITSSASQNTHEHWYLHLMMGGVCHLLPTIPCIRHCSWSVLPCFSVLLVRMNNMLVPSPLDGGRLSRVADY
jgi:hypothetical protein